MDKCYREMILLVLNNEILQEKKILKFIAKLLFYLPRGLRFHELSEYFLVFLIANKKFWNHSMVKIVITSVTLKSEVVILVEQTTSEKLFFNLILRFLEETYAVT